MDADANTFSATASGLVLSGLPNPFALQLGTDVSSACGIVRLQSVSPGQYQLNPADPPPQPCAMPAPPVPEPPVVPAGTATQVTFKIAATGLDPGSAMLFPADDNAQPSGPALCILSDNGDGTWSCTASFNETNVGTIPLVVQATAGGQPVLAPGSFIQAVAPVADADVQQITDLQNIFDTTSGQAKSQYGDSVYARIQVLEALRQYMQAPVGLTGQPVSLSPDGWELGISTASGVQMAFVMGDSDDDVVADTRRPQVRHPGGRTAISARPAPRGPAGQSPQPRYTKPECTEFSRDIVQNNQVLFWDPGSVFFPTSDPTPSVVQQMRSAICPKLDIKVLKGGDASDGAMSSFSQYGTVVMMTHGGVDMNHRFFIVTGTPLSPEAFRLAGLLGLTSKGDEGISCFTGMGCFLTVYSNFSGIQVAPNTVVFGGFCNGFLGQYPGASRGGLLGPDVPFAVAPGFCAGFYRRLFRIRLHWLYEYHRNGGRDGFRQHAAKWRIRIRGLGGRNRLRSQSGGFPIGVQPGIHRQPATGPLHRASSGTRLSRTGRVYGWDAELLAESELHERDVG